MEVLVQRLSHDSRADEPESASPRAAFQPKEERIRSARFFVTQEEICVWSIPLRTSEVLVLVSVTIETAWCSGFL